MRDRGTNFKPQAARQLLAQHTFKTPKVMHIYDDNGKSKSIDNLLQGPTEKIWSKALINEWGRLSQGNDRDVASIYTIEYIEPSQVPTGCKVTYVSFVSDN